MSKSDPLLIYKLLQDEYGAPGTVLVYGNPLELTVATILSAQCTDKRVNQVTELLFEKYRRVEDYLRVEAEEFERDIRSTGFFRNKARNIRGMCEQVIAKHGGVIPATMEELISLPGIGRKSANVILSNAFGKVEGIAVDTHVKRLSRRLGFSNFSDPGRIERELMELFPRDQWVSLTYLLIEHGRAQCRARKPACRLCRISDYCPSAEVV